MSNIRLYTTYYSEKTNSRIRELLNCLQRNLNNPAFKSVVVFNEGGDLSAFKSTKLKVIPISQRPLYQDFFRYINQNIKDEDIHIIANTDIYFDKHIAVLNYLDLSYKILALSRWDTAESDKPKLYNHNDSQDVWIFKGRIKSDLKADFPLGVPRCDNRLFYELQESGYRVLNPAFTLNEFGHGGEKRSFQIHKLFSDVFEIVRVNNIKNIFHPWYIRFWAGLKFY